MKIPKFDESRSNRVSENLSEQTTSPSIHPRRAQLFYHTNFRSYIRFVAVFFLGFALFFVIQSAFIHFHFTNRIMPFYVREKKDLTSLIKEEILRESRTNPHFNLRNYIMEQNKRFPRLKLDFIPKSQVLADERADIQYRSLYFLAPNHRSRLLEAVPLNFKGEPGYLIIYSNRFRSLNNNLNQLTIFMFVSVLLAVVIGFFIFRGFNGKTKTLVEAVNKISHGNYGVRVSLNGNDEFSFIGHSINHMAASIEKATMELKAMDQQRRRFIADISHELATPLTAIKGYVETLQMEDFQSSPAEKRQYLQIIGEETERLSFLVKDLLEIARVDAGTITIEREEINAEEFMKAFVERNDFQLRKCGVQLEYAIEPGLSVYADYRRLEQIFQNLLDNALKHSNNLNQVSINMTKSGNRTEIRFRDNGAGIPMEYLERIFDRFYQIPLTRQIGSESSRAIGTNGLGLSIVKGLVELHQGTISVASRLGEETVFSITLPEKADKI